MELPLYHHPVRVYASPSTECLLQRPGGPRFATQETDPFGDPYIVGVQVGFRRRSLGTRPIGPAWEPNVPEEGPCGAGAGPAGRRWSVAALEVGRRARESLRRASHGHGHGHSHSPPHGCASGRGSPPALAGAIGSPPSQAGSPGARRASLPAQPPGTGASPHRMADPLPTPNEGPEDEGLEEGDEARARYGRGRRRSSVTWLWHEKGDKAA